MFFSVPHHKWPALSFHSRTIFNTLRQNFHHSFILCWSVCKIITNYHITLIFRVAELLLGYQAVNIPPGTNFRLFYRIRGTLFPTCYEVKTIIRPVVHQRHSFARILSPRHACTCSRRSKRRTCHAVLSTCPFRANHTVCREVQPPLWESSPAQPRGLRCWAVQAHLGNTSSWGRCSSTGNRTVRRRMIPIRATPTSS